VDRIDLLVGVLIKYQTNCSERIGKDQGG